MSPVFHVRHIDQFGHTDYYYANSSEAEPIWGKVDWYPVLLECRVLPYDRRVSPDYWLAHEVARV